MEASPKGRDIEQLDGDAKPIIDRGNAITTLGNQMTSSADMLQKIADGAVGQKGLAIDKVKDVVGDSYKDLKLAGERYKPTGPILVTYGQVLSEVQPLIATAVKNCEDDWVTYQSRLGDVSTAQDPTAAPSGGEPADPTAADAQAQAAKDAVDKAQGVADSAYDAWEAEAKTFDSHYDTWEDAFNAAADGIGDAIDGGISDGFWDNVDGFVAAALEVLKWVGIALAVLCLVIGGPFLAMLAAIVAISTLLLTVYAYSRGNASGWDLAFAIIGVIPFGSAGKLFNGGKMEFLNDAAGGLLKSGSRGAITGELSGITHGMRFGFTRGGGGLDGLIRGLRGARRSWMGPNGMGAGNIISRVFTGQRMSYFNGSVPPLNILGSVLGDGYLKNLYLNADALSGGRLHGDGEG